ncbi:hypothetical protein E4M02_03150 [Brevundimonas sp. S30B]|uniref:hypothetical protein n=1 Tax=unclassified Brevundimonas TaxID=2622653 RepID=UPI001072B8A2|nr:MULTISPECIES: hypothetical protein [unclassified Brevundimonas]QBX37120.1 hypothetical protein E4M01_04665 [Brevundimonas sp. MF30-B]TFW04085.1 hypothetical protein E4M02_03150 [Brevundimonas sp. S30B]
MMKFRVPLIAALAAMLPLTEALAHDAWDQSRGRDRDRSEQSQDRGPPDRGRDRGRESMSREAPRADLGAIVRGVSAGRPGRMLGVSPRGDGYVVRWEYPGGRVGDIMVDGRTGRVTGER